MYDPSVSPNVSLDNAAEGQPDTEHVQPRGSNDFRFWWGLGYRSLIPIVPPGVELSPTCQLAKKLVGGRDDRGKAPGVLRPDGLWTGLYGWQVRETIEADLDRWQTMGAGVGLADDGGLVILDIDAQDEATADSIEAEALEILGPAPCRVGSWPKRLLLYRIDVTLPYMWVTFKGPGPKPDRVEVLAKPKQGVVAGIHSGTGKPYEWRRPPVARDQLTLVMKQQVDTFFARLENRLPAATVEKGATLTDREAIDQKTLKGDVALVRKAVAAIPNTAALFPSYDSMVKMGEAIHGACTDDDEVGREIWHEWAERWEGGDYDFDVSDARWETFRAPHSIGAAYLYWLAEQHSAGTFTKGDVWHEEITESSSSLEGVTTAPKPPKFQFLSFNEVAATALSHSTLPLVEELLDQGAMSVLYGESNTGKTFVAMDLAYHIASGRPWGGRQTEQRCVVYVAAEGGGGARKRAAALLAKYGPCPDFLYLLCPVNLLDPNADLEPLIEALRGVERLGFIVLDTLSRMLAGGDENSSVDMGALVRHFDAVRNATGAHLMVVHHTGKNLARGARGHSLLRAATDTEIEVSAADGIRVTKQRDLGKCSAVAFGFETVVLGQDARGRDVTSGTIRLIARGDVEVEEITPREAEVLQAVNTALAATANPAKGAKLAAIATALGEPGAEGANRARGHLNNLTAKNRLVKVDQGRWAPRDIHAATYFEAIDPPDGAPKNLGEIRSTETPQNGKPQPTVFGPSVDVFA